MLVTFKNRSATLLIQPFTKGKAKYNVKSYFRVTFELFEKNI